jgi:hypothetical protein
LLIAETVEDEIARQELLATVRSFSKPAVVSIMSEGAEVKQKRSKVSVQVGQQYSVWCTIRFV